MSIDNTKPNDRYSVELDGNGAYITWNNPARRTDGNYTFELEFLCGALHLTQTILDYCSYAAGNRSEGLAVEWRDPGACWVWIGGDGSGGGFTGGGIWNVGAINFLRIEVRKITTTPPLSDILIYGNWKLLATFAGIDAVCYLPITTFRIGAALNSVGVGCQFLSGRVYQGAYRNGTGVAMPRMDGQPYDQPATVYQHKWKMIEGTGLSLVDSGSVGTAPGTIIALGGQRWSSEIWRRNSECNEMLAVERR